MKVFTVVLVEENNFSESRGGRATENFQERATFLYFPHTVCSPVIMGDRMIHSEATTLFPTVI